MNETIHKALNLPSRYRAQTSIAGLVRIGDSIHEQRRIELKFMITDTLGQEAIWAIRDGNGKWRETSYETFSTLAFVIITGDKTTCP